jgi:hypothetical protein
MQIGVPAPLLSARHEMAQHETAQHEKAQQARTQKHAAPHLVQ